MTSHITISKRVPTDIDSEDTHYTLPFHSFTFPGGEVSVKLETATNTALRYLVAEAEYQLVTARLQSAHDVMELLMVVDALRRFERLTPIHLLLPYVPGGRQDRVCVDGEAFSLLVYAKLIANLGATRVTTYDPHSEVTAALFDSLGTHLNVITQKEVIGRFDALQSRILREGARTVLVSPDAGANKKTSLLAAYFGHADFIRADKLRDLSTGAIKETVVYGELDGRDAIVVDDLCDGGATFIALAKALKTKGAPKVVLYTTHGLYSKGSQTLLDSGIDELYSTTSFRSTWPANVTGVTTMDLEEAFRL